MLHIEGNRKNFINRWTCQQMHEFSTRY